MTSNLLQQKLQTCSPDMQARIAYKLAIQEARRRFWLGLWLRLICQAETVVTTAAVLGTLAIMMVPGINRVTTEWYASLSWLHEGADVITGAIAPQSDDAESKAAIAPDARIFPIPGQTHATAAFTSGYGPRPSPGGIGSSYHRGLDYAAPIGTPLLAVESGTVETWTDDSCGNGLEIKARKRSFIYCHLHEHKVQNGQSVKAGDVIGTVGNTGNSTGPHLHIGIIENGDYIDPTEYFKSLPATLEPKAAKEVEEYFAEISGSEFGTSTQLLPMRDAQIEILGDATDSDRTELERIVQELRALGAGDLRVVPSGGNVQIHFAPPDQFAALEPKYVPGNLGFFWRDRQGSSARILITSTDRVTERERFHLLREELTQALTGLARDSDRYPDSIFYQGWTDVTEFSEIDKAVIKKAFQR